MREDVARITLRSEIVSTRGNIMTSSQKLAFLAFVLCAFAAPASARNGPDVGEIFMAPATFSGRVGYTTH
jgi:hypothetical protein